MVHTPETSLDAAEPIRYRFLRNKCCRFWHTAAAIQPGVTHSSIQARYSRDPPPIATFTISGVSYV